jgi:hypothetical protein
MNSPPDSHSLFCRELSTCRLTQLVVIMMQHQPGKHQPQTQLSEWNSPCTEMLHTPYLVIEVFEVMIAYSSPVDAAVLCSIALVSTYHQPHPANITSTIALDQPWKPHPYFYTAKISTIYPCASRLWEDYVGGALDRQNCQTLFCGHYA